MPPAKKQPSKPAKDAPSAARRAAPRTEEAASAAIPAQPPLSATQKRYLRGFAHDLKPVILVGQKGVTPALLKELDAALAHHELVKIKLADDDRDARAEAIEQIRAASGADLVQTIGRTACLYRRNPKRAQYTLPK
jgi:RNA-binding protein